MLYAAWIFLLTAFGACLVRIYAHHAYTFSDAAKNRAESEIAYIDVDSEIISERGTEIVYSDSSTPFDKARELKINKENREVWQQALKVRQKGTEKGWGLVKATQLVAGSAMLVGFLLLIGFAVITSSQPAPPLHICP